MVTNLELNFRIGTKQPGYVYKDYALMRIPRTRFTGGGVDERAHPGDKIRIRVPYFMPDIEEDDECTYTIGSGNDIFINSGSCRPRHKMSIKTQPYVEMTYEKNQETRPLYKGDRVITDYYQESLNKFNFNTNE